MAMKIHKLLMIVYSYMWLVFMHIKDTWKKDTWKKDAQEWRLLYTMGDDDERDSCVS